MNNFVTSYIINYNNKVSYREQNCLSLGCRHRRERDDSNSVPLKNCPEVEYFFSNTIKSLLEWSSDWAPLWSKLASRIGEILMRRLLSQPIFCPVQNGCYIQVAGTPLSEVIRQQSLKRKTQDKVILNPYVIRKDIIKIYDRSKSVDVVGLTTIPRFAIYYRSSYTHHAGLPKNHIFLKKNISGNIMIKHMFQIDDDITNVNNVISELSKVFETIITNYKACNIFDSLTKFCPLPNTRPNQNEQKYDSLTIEPETLSSNNLPTQSTNSFLSGFQSQDIFSSRNIEPNSIIKKTKRGCRSGLKTKNKKEIRIKSSQSKYKPTTIKAIEKKIITVGEKLFQNVLRNAKNVLIDEGFQSQEQDDDDCIGVKRTMDQQPINDSKNILNSVIENDDSNISFKYSISSSEISTNPFRNNNNNSNNNNNNNKDDILALSLSSCHDIGLQKHLISRNFMTTGSLNSNDIKSDDPLNNHPSVKRQKKISDEDLSQLDQVSWSSPPENVSSFIKSICRRVFTLKQVWGCRKNLNIFLKNVDLYIHLARFETITINEIIKGIQINSIPWMKKAIEKTRKNKQSPIANEIYEAIFKSENDMDIEIEVATQKDDDNDTSSSKYSEQYIFNVFIFWIFADFINPLLSATFYITEAEGRSNDTTFFRKPIWARVIERGKVQMDKHFIQLPFYAEESSDPKVGQKRTQSLQRTQSSNDAKVFPPLKRLRSIDALPTIRFLPKKNSVRPITNFRIKSDSYESRASSISLYNCMHVLKHIYNRNPVLIGFGAFGFDEIYMKVRRYKEMLKSNQDNNLTDQKFYIATVDLEKCYDNVDSKQLYNLVNDLLNGENNSVDDYVLHRYTVSHYITSLERVVTKTLRLVGDGMITFEEASNKIAEKYRNSIITDNVLYAKVDKDEILKTISNHLFNHVVKMPFTKDSTSSGRNCYTQVKGIPQGSVLSPHLCNLYYGNAERMIFGTEEEVNKLGLTDKSVIIRLMDDFIMISTSKEAVTHFLQRAHQKFKLYGGNINPLKTRVNVPTEIEVDGKRIELNVIPSHILSWCGLSIDTHTLEFKPCFNRILDPSVKLASSMTVERCFQVGTTLRRFIKSFVRTKCHAIVLDSSINSYPSVLESVYTMFLVAAMRTACYIRKLGFTKERLNFVCKCIDEAVKFGAHLIHTRTRNKVHKNFTILDEDDNIDDNSDTKDLKLFSTYTVPFSYSNYGHCELTQMQACRIGFKAFLTCMERNSSYFSKIIEHLKFKLSGSEKNLSNDVIAIDDEIISKIKMEIRHK